MRIPYESEMWDAEHPFFVEMYHDEMMALVTVICNKYGWTKAERRDNNMPHVLESAMRGVIEGANKAAR
jgi:hypothetical protein